MKNVIPPTILIIVGITGDLSKRKLLPAIEKIVQQHAAPKNLKVIGITRRDVSVAEALNGTQGLTGFLAKNLEMYQMDLSSASDYKSLGEYIKRIEAAWGQAAQRLFYLSVPPQISQPVIKLLGESDIAKEGNSKLLLEKPFGTDLQSAKELVSDIKTYFQEDQVYRIDHYLAKEMAQNIVLFRQANPLFQHTWNNKFVERIEIIASEKIGIEGRALFYEQTGALRDLVQSHLLQLAALTLAKWEDEDWTLLPKARLEALQAIKTPTNVSEQAHRGQYRGYREETSNPRSMVETFVSLTLFSKNSDWTGVPIKLVTGKALGAKTTEIRIFYKNNTRTASNTLTLRLQPNEGVEIDLWAKQPGYDRTLKKYALDFTYGNHENELPEAYERVFVDAMRGDHTLFATSEEVLETWRILEPVQHAWSMNEDDLQFYTSDLLI